MGRDTVTVDRDQLRALADAATPGPWYAASNDAGLESTCISTRAETVARPVDTCGDDCCGPITESADAEFIAACRTAVPELCDLLDRCEPLLVAQAQDRCEWRNVNHAYCPTEDCDHARARALLAELKTTRTA